MQSLKKLVETELKTQLYEAEFVLKSDRDKNITIVTDNLRGVCGITVVTVLEPAVAVSASAESTVVKVKFFLLEATVREQLVRIAREANSIAGVFSLMPRLRTAKAVFSRIYRQKQKAQNNEDKMYDGKRILIIDQLNLFFRNYIVNPSLSVNGQPIGGLKGCFQSIQKIVRESKPDLIITCWDGEGGSAKRKSMNKDYKAGRKPIRLNRGIRNMSEQQEMENKIWQQTRLIEYYNQTPIIQFMYKSTEADDIIAYLSNMKELEGAEKLIISSDKDFFQLLDEKTVLYRPIQKEILNENKIIEKFNIHPVNFAMARAMAGDKSDNIEGIEGLGLKTIAKRFPMLKDSNQVTIDGVLKHAQSSSLESNVKAYARVVEKIDVVERNYKMMQLYAPILTIDSKKSIRDTMNNPDLSFNKTELLKMMLTDGFGEINFIELFQNFNRISLDN